MPAIGTGAVTAMAGATPLAVLAAWSPLALARPLSWFVVLAFLGGALLERRDRERARDLAVGGLALFGVFWLVLVPHFVFEQKSIVEGLGAIAAVPLSLYAGYLLWNGRDSLFVMTKAIGIMGLIYLPFTYLPLVGDNPAREWLAETVAGQTKFLMSLIGVTPDLIQNPDCGQPGFSQDYCYNTTFHFVHAGPETPDVLYTIIIACTGLGSMAIFAGAILAVQAPARRKVRAFAVSIPVIYVLNLFRNVFIATSFGEMRMQYFPKLTASLFGFSLEEHPAYVSYYLADRILAQFGSVIALIAITWLVVRELPELTILVEDTLYLLTGNEYDLQSVVGMDEPSATPAD